MTRNINYLEFRTLASTFTHMADSYALREDLLRCIEKYEKEIKDKDTRSTNIERDFRLNLIDRLGSPYVDKGLPLDELIAIAERRIIKANELIQKNIIKLGHDYGITVEDRR